MHNKKTLKKITEAVKEDNLLKLKYYQRYLKRLNNEYNPYNLFYSSRYQLFRYSIFCNSLKCTDYLYNYFNFTEKDFSNFTNLQNEFKQEINILNRKRKINKILNGINKN